MPNRFPSQFPPDNLEPHSSQRRLSKWSEAYASVERVSELYRRAMERRPDPAAFGTELANAVLSLPRDRKFLEFARILSVLTHSIRMSFAYGTSEMTSYYRGIRTTFASGFLERAFAVLSSDASVPREILAAYRDWLLVRAMADQSDFDFWMGWHERFRSLGDEEKPA